MSFDLQEDPMTPVTREHPEFVDRDELHHLDVPLPLAAEPRQSWTPIVIGLIGVIATLALVVGIFAFAGRDNQPATKVVKTAAPVAKVNPADQPAPTLAQSKGIKFEAFKPVDPTLPAVPSGAVKHFTVGVMQHVAQVSPDLAPVQAWTYTVNGKAYRGTAASPPIVVNVGDKVSINFVNGGSKAMHVDMAHSIDFHSAEVAPSKYYVDVKPGGHETINFVAKHPGVFMYHCATQPVLMHTGAGMTGMMVVKPRNLPKVDRELWMTQQEFYIGEPGGLADMAKMQAKKPDVIAFNGYANQYKVKPITVGKGQKIRMFVLNAGPSIWSAFHVIGTVFDTTHVEGVVGHDSQTVNLAPSQGGWVEFTLDQEGNFPFVTHAFGDMTKGAAGMLHTTHAPIVKPAAPAADTTGAAAAKADVNVTLGDMWVKTDAPSFKAGKVSFAVKNTGATMHALGIVKAPANVAGGMLDESTLIAAGDDLAAGAGGSITADLKPGSYELVCHVPGHYAAGQHIPFTVN